MKKLLILTLAVMSVIAMAPNAVTAETTLVYGTTEQVTDMDPANAYDFHTWEIFYNIYQGLMGYPPGKTDLVPALAESYRSSMTARGTSSSSGKGSSSPTAPPSTPAPLNGPSIASSGSRAILPGWSPILSTASRWSTTTTVKFNLKNPVAYFPSLVATVPYYPVNPNVYPADKIVRDPGELKGGKLVGLGAYKVVSFKRDEEIILDVNPNYWGHKPKNDRIVIRYFADATTMRLALLKRVKSTLPSNPSTRRTSMTCKKIGRHQDFVGEGPYIRYLVLPVRRSTFNDKVLRQGVGRRHQPPGDHQKVFLGQNMPLYSMVPKGMWTHTDNFKDVFG